MLVMIGKGEDDSNEVQERRNNTLGELRGIRRMEE